jgi:hypothetical protein
VSRRRLPYTVQLKQSNFINLIARLVLE